MTTEMLLEIVKTRTKAENGNPTSQSFFYELIKALERLKEYERNQ